MLSFTGEVVQGGGKFRVWINFTKHFFLIHLLFLRVDRKKTPPPPLKLKKFHKLDHMCNINILYIYIYIYILYIFIIYIIYICIDSLWICHISGKWWQAIHDTESVQISQKHDGQHTCNCEKMCPPGYQHNCFVAIVTTYVFGHMMCEIQTKHSL